MLRKSIGIITSAAIMASLIAGCSSTNSTASTTTSSKDTVKAIQTVEVELSAGTLVGLNDNSQYSFRGIPYATAERFKDPEPVTSYTDGKQMAISYGAVAPQDRTLDGTASVNDHEFMTPSNGTADMVANEDCQYLNVWTDNLSAKKPVVVFFHGGGLMNGASSELSYYNGSYFAETEDAVFVSVNHRLNVLGYLDLSTYDSNYSDSANVGMEDCVEALIWVKNNISNFGGDPSNVTIVGQSGGGTKVTTLACMSDTQDLFNKVFVMSGGYSTKTMDDAKANTDLLVKQLGLSSDNVISTLTSMSYEDLLNAATEAKCSWSTYVGSGTFEAPFLDADGNMNKYAAERTWMIGTTFSEFGDNGTPLIYYGNKDASLDKTDDEAMTILEGMYGDDTQEFAEEFKKTYEGHSLIEAVYMNASPAAFSTGRAGLISTTLDNMAKNTTVFNYVTAYVQPFAGGVTMYHTSDVPYWFNSIDTASYLIEGDSDNAHSFAKTCADSLYNFATNNDPSSSSLAWKAWTNEEHNTMVLGVKSSNCVDGDAKMYEIMSNHQEK